MEQPSGGGDMKPRLLPCPFCDGGGSPRVAPHRLRFRVLCGGCGSMTSPERTPEAAAGKWNNRRAIALEAPADGYRAGRL